MIEHQNKPFQKKDLIARYGSAFRQNASEKVICLDRHVEIDFDFQVHRIEHMVKEFKGAMPPSRISHYVIALIKKGSGFKTIGCHNFRVQSDMAMIIPKYGIHSSTNWSLKNKGYMLSFNEDFFLNLNLPKSLLNLSVLFKSSRKPYCLLSEQMTRNLSFIFEEILSEQTGSTRLKKELIGLKTAQLIVYYHRIFNTITPEPDADTLLYDQFSDLLEKHYIYEKSVGYYARKLCIHPNHLNFKIKEITGFSVKNIIQNRVILEAKYLLLVTSMSIKEISYELGFKDQNNFSRFFKKWVGVPPVEFRKTQV